MDVVVFTHRDSETLVAEPMAPVEPEAVRAAIERVRSERDQAAAALEEARAWEHDVMAARPAVAARIVELAGA